jgi:hypothetical protein
MAKKKQQKSRFAQPDGSVEFYPPFEATKMLAPGYLTSVLNYLLGDRPYHQVLTINRQQLALPVISADEVVSAKKESLLQSAPSAAEYKTEIEKVAAGPEAGQEVGKITKIDIFTDQPLGPVIVEFDLPGFENGRQAFTSAVDEVFHVNYGWKKRLPMVIVGWLSDPTMPASEIEELRVALDQRLQRLVKMRPLRGIADFSRTQVNFQEDLPKLELPE